MRPPVVAIYNNGFKKATPMIYDGVNWVRAAPYVYNGEWQPAGAAGTLMIKFIDSNGNEIHTSDGLLLLVRED